ncbi:MAG: T9SS type A sorting domain-containing protein, partial [Bacteroidales bacterium]|nr:T9SS type A sorting domain-containing protein [Bacteroidales bacterium]
VEVTDANNCGPVTTGEIILTQPEPVAINNIDTTFVSSDGAADASIIVDASGGTPPLSYILNPDSIEVNETGQFTGVAADEYRVVVTDQHECQPDTSEVITIEVAPDTRTDELEAEYHLRIYPNPAENRVTLSMNMTDIRSDIKVHILNTIGQLQQVIRFKGTNQEMVREVNLNDYRGGVYVLKFFDEEDYLGQRLLIISR